MDVLGITAYGLGSGAALVRDGCVIAAASEAHFTRNPAESGLPRRAIRSCLASGGIQARDLDAIVLDEKPLRRFERVLAGQLAAFPRSSRSFPREVFAWLGDRMWIKSRLASDLGVDTNRIHFSARTVSLAASAYFASSFEDAAILVIDGDGEWAATSFASARDSRIDIIAEGHHPHSLVLAARAVAKWLGFVGTGGEALCEALATRGEPRHAQAMSEFIRVADDARVELDPRAFVDDLVGGLACGSAWIARFGLARHVGDSMSTSGATADHAASFQRVLETAVIALAHEVRRRVSSPRLCFVGALASNSTLVARLAEGAGFHDVFVPPWCDESGLALGAAWHGTAVFQPTFRPNHPAGEPRGEDLVVEERLARVLGASADLVSDESIRHARIHAALCRGWTVGWVRGRVELGVGSLGSRIILADASHAGIAARMSNTVIRRESFVPPVVLVTAENCVNMFDVPSALRCTSPTRVVAAKPGPAALTVCAELADGHGFVRVQSVDRNRDPALHALLGRFDPPLLLVAALAPRGEPVVRGERDAVSFFERSALDLLVVDDRVYERS